MNPVDYLSSSLSSTQTFTVQAEHTAAHLGSGLVKVVSTPSMILFMEITARNMLDQALPAGYSSVGTRVDVRHLAPAPVGGVVVASASVQKVESNTVLLSVSVKFGDIVIGEGQHERYVIEVARFLKRFTK